ncbi:hypothetical protein [Actinoallomurus acaciae]|uniref:Integral membrane protein n=1 Tax=Actinoallomurus acaciae TaxID=502577 RepID=A0ABV5YEC1_9ACTN
MERVTYATVEAPGPVRSVIPAPPAAAIVTVPTLKAHASVTKILLIVHVLAAVLAVGPVAVAASMFPVAVRRAGAGLAPGRDGPAMAGARLLHRVCRVYAVAGVAVPVFGLATAGAMHVTGDTWVVVSIVLTALAAAVLALLVLPRQQALLAGATTGPARLAMYTGLFNILWAAVTVLMIVRPGSTTGA